MLLLDFIDYNSSLSSVLEKYPYLKCEDESSKCHKIRNDEIIEFSTFDNIYICTSNKSNVKKIVYETEIEPDSKKAYSTYIEKIKSVTLLYGYAAESFPVFSTKNYEEMKEAPFTYLLKFTEAEKIYSIVFKYKSDGENQGYYISLEQILNDTDIENVSNNVKKIMLKDVNDQHCPNFKKEFNHLYKLDEEDDDNSEIAKEIVSIDELSDNDEDSVIDEDEDVMIALSDKSQETENTSITDLSDNEEESAIDEDDDVMSSSSISSEEQTTSSTEEIVEDQEVEKQKEEQPSDKYRKQAKKSLQDVRLASFFGIVTALAILILFSKEPFTQSIQNGSLTNNIYYILSFIFYIATLIAIPSYVYFNIYWFKTNIQSSKDIFTEHKTEKKGPVHYFYRKLNKLLDSYKDTFITNNTNIKEHKTRENADMFFNSENILANIFPHFPLGSVMKLAGGSFIGFGILGTFIGFSSAMQNLDLQNTETIEAGINLLVKEGLATAFNTSIIGVVCSLLYNFLIYSPLLQNMDLYFDKLCDDLDKNFYISDTEMLMNTTMVETEDGEIIPFNGSIRCILDKMDEQKTAMSDFSTTLAEKIANVEYVVNKEMCKFTGDLSAEVTASLLNGVEDEIEDLKESLVKATENLNTATDSIAETVDKIDNDTATIITNFNDALRKSLDESNKALGIVETVPDKLTSIVDSLSTAGDTMASNSESIASSFAENSEQLAENMKNASDIMSTNLASASNSLASEISAASSSLSDNVQSATDALVSNLGAVSDNLNTLVEYINNVSDSTNTILEQTNENEEYSRTNLEQLINETNNILDNFKKVDQNISNVFEGIIKQISSYNNTSSDVLGNYLSRFADSTKDFGLSVQSSVTNLSNTIDSFNSSLSEVSKNSENFGKQVKKLEDTLLSERKNK